MADWPRTFATSLLLSLKPLSALFDNGTSLGSITFNDRVVAAATLDRPVWRGVGAGSIFRSIGDPSGIGTKTLTWTTSFSGSSGGVPRVSWIPDDENSMLGRNGVPVAKFTNFDSDQLP